MDHKNICDEKFWKTMRNYQEVNIKNLYSNYNAAYLIKESVLINSKSYLQQQSVLFDEKLDKMRNDRLELELEYKHLINKFCDNTLLVKEKLEKLDAKFLKTPSLKIQIYNKRISWYKQETKNAKSKMEVLQNDKKIEEYFGHQDIFSIQNMTNFLLDLSLSKYGDSYKIQQDLFDIQNGLARLEENVEEVVKKYN